VARNAERFRILLQHSTEAVVVVGRDLRIVYATGPVERMLGSGPGDLTGTTFADLVHPQEWTRVEALLTKTVEGPVPTSTQDIRLRRGDRGWLRSQTVVANLLDDPNVGGLVLTIRDVSQRRALEDQLRQIAFHDPLTGLPNRARFLDGVGEALAAKGDNHTSCAVLIIEIDDLKRVDSLGHSAGDQLMQAIAERIQQILGFSEDLLLARLREDEFAILAQKLTDAEEAVALARSLLVAFQTAVEIAGRSILPHANIGIAMAGFDSADGLLRNADVAMYQARHRGRGCYQVFNPAMRAAAVLRLELEQELRWAVERQEFVVHYQPVVRLGDCSISGVEALLRWQHPTRGLILPDDFIPLAEETGLIIPIGDWVLGEACRYVAKLQQRHGDDRLRVAVNVSSRQFTDPSFEEQIAQALGDSGIDPTTLVLEITETSLMADTADTVGRMMRLRHLGISFAMDDFGRGYSSLSYLHRYPIQMLKIDRSFIEALGEGAESTALILAILSLASTLGMQVVAEGVEEGWQAELLQRLGCTLAQGFYFARPMDRKDLAQTLGGSVENRTLPAAGTPSGVHANDKVMLLSPLGLPVAGCLADGG
jgi:diguanylate cyclase (GGDEF)-like protein/PAS domain S-box-containing protein